MKRKAAKRRQRIKRGGEEDQGDEGKVVAV
jgi:hypothetical protein